MSAVLLHGRAGRCSSAASSRSVSALIVYRGNTDVEDVALNVAGSWRSWSPSSRPWWTRPAPRAMCRRRAELTRAVNNNVTALLVTGGVVMVLLWLVPCAGGAVEPASGTLALWPLLRVDDRPGRASRSCRRGVDELGPGPWALDRGDRAVRHDRHRRADQCRRAGPHLAGQPAEEGLGQPVPVDRDRDAGVVRGDRGRAPRVVVVHAVVLLARGGAARSSSRSSGWSQTGRGCGIGSSATRPSAPALPPPCGFDGQRRGFRRRPRTRIRGG